MARLARLTYDRIAALIRARGPMSATELAALLAADRSSVGRALHQFGDELVCLGATRSTRYVMRKSIRERGMKWPIYRIDSDGNPQQWSELEAFHDRAWRLSWSGAAPAWADLFKVEHGLWNGFPFFLNDVRPQGFLGRILAERLSSLLQVPQDPRQWSDEDTLVALITMGDDLPGDLVVGDACLRRAMITDSGGSEKTIAPSAQRAEIYAERARKIVDTLPGSSAGGGQPKFLAHVLENAAESRAVLVKFSPPIEQQTGRRWADLLACEFHAHEVLAEAGLSMPGANLLEIDGRRFLEVPRFDRNGTRGRKGVVTMESLAGSALDKTPTDWLSAANALQRIGLITEDAVSTIRLLQAFGEQIGNSDMHLGNFAFFLTDELPLRPTPCYDMLPMLWAPSAQGEIVERRLSTATPTPAMLDTWQQASTMAEKFWTRVKNDPRIELF